MTHLLMSKTSNGCSLSRTPAPKFEPQELSGWHGLLLEGDEVTFFAFKIEPNAMEYPIHASDEVWMAYVISGSGQLFAGDDEMQKTEGTEFRAGDIISFDANTAHGWLNGDRESQILFVKRNN